MRYILGFAALMALLTTPARMKGAEFVVVNNCQKFTVVNNCAVKPTRLQNASHYCPTCGLYQNVVVREENGEHSHKCNHAGTVHAGEPPTEWWHADPPAAPFTLPASGCPNGQCPAPSTPRWRLFR